MQKTKTNQRAGAGPESARFTIAECEAEIRLGEQLIEILKLRRVRGYNNPPRYATTWGTKTALGIVRTVEAIMKGGAQ